MIRIAKAILTLGVLLSPLFHWNLPQANAAPIAVERRNLTDGVDRPSRNISGDGDSSHLDLNPALLSDLPAFDLTLRGYGTTNRWARGSGFGIFTGTNLGFGVALGMGLQIVKPQLDGSVVDHDAHNNPAGTKLSLGLSFGDADIVAFGFAFHGLRSQGRWQRIADLDLGGIVRITRFASLGLMARLAPLNFNIETEHRSELRLASELALRPLGTHNLEIAGGFQARIDQTQGVGLKNFRSSQMLGHGRIGLQWQGISLAGEVQQIPIEQYDSQTFQPTGVMQRGLRGSIVWGVAWDHVAAKLGLLSGPSKGVDGISLMARYSSEKQGRVWWSRKAAIERIQLDEISNESQLIATLIRLQRASKAGKKSILLIDAKSTKLGWASIQELRNAIIKLRGTGAKVYSYVENAGLKEYYLASAGEKVWIHPGGSLEIFGLSQTTLYYRQALEKLGVQAESLHIGEYKSANDPFTQSRRSEADLQQRSKFLSDVYTRVVQDISRTRDLISAEITKKINESPHPPGSAIESGLVDGELHRDEIENAISVEVGASLRYAEFHDNRPENPIWSTKPYVAIVLVEGTIVDGKSLEIPFLNLKYVGDQTIKNTLQELRDDRNCQGIILRVNSPGGSALASEKIWREVERTQHAHQKSPDSSPPIVVSMSDLAASGGYYLSMGASQVLAQDLTLTGSIGVTSLHFDISGLLDKLGIQVDTLKVGTNANVEDIYHQYTEDQRSRLMSSIRHVYDLFRKRVADSRGLSMDKVHELARGRIYSGKHAKRLNLVDQIGGLQQAMAALERQRPSRFALKNEIRIMPHRSSLLDLLVQTVAPMFGKRGRFDRASSAKEFIPLVFQQAIARLPLSIVMLPQDRPHAILPASIEIH